LLSCHSPNNGSSTLNSITDSRDFGGLSLDSLPLNGQIGSCLICNSIGFHNHRLHLINVSLLSKEIVCVFPHFLSPSIGSPISIGFDFILSPNQIVFCTGVQCRFEISALLANVFLKSFQIEFSIVHVLLG